MEVSVKITIKHVSEQAASVMSIWIGKAVPVGL
jgi:hypothetical protein